MNPSNPLETIYYISIPNNFMPSQTAFKIDKNIKLPVQKKVDEAPGSFNPSEITTEQILAGILTVLAYLQSPSYSRRQLSTSLQASSSES